jgi:hypothetical protein
MSDFAKEMTASLEESVRFARNENMGPQDIQKLRERVDALVVLGLLTIRERQLLVAGLCALGTAVAITE